jgi:hypothetical protein
VGIRRADHATLTSPTSGGRLVGVVHLRTTATEFSFCCCCEELQSTRPTLNLQETCHRDFSFGISCTTVVYGPPSGGSSMHFNWNGEVVVEARPKLMSRNVCGGYMSS